MNISIHLDLTDDLHRSIFTEIQARLRSTDLPAATATAVEEVKPKKERKKRRTKAEMAADAKAEADDIFTPTEPIAPVEDATPQVGPERGHPDVSVDEVKKAFTDACTIDHDAALGAFNQMRDTTGAAGLSALNGTQLAILLDDMKKILEVSELPS